MLIERVTEMLSTIFPGLYMGTVEKLEGNGCLQVSIPSVFASTKPESFVIARPCFPYGHFFVPEVKDKVWIAFENGDPRAPVWLGVWYPEGKVPQDADISPPVKKVIFSASGNKIIIDDSRDSEQIIVADKTGNIIKLTTNGIFVADKAGNNIKISDKQFLIQCKTNLTIDATGQKVLVKAKSVDVEEAN